MKSAPITGEGWMLETLFLLLFLFLNLFLFIWTVLTTYILKKIRGRIKQLCEQKTDKKIWQVSSVLKENVTIFEFACFF